ncbi:TFIIH complex serine/threonine-protein kinase subunit kin28 [Thelotrema lepadinum]|nr:TFIIH complex serine/threonine-protein kinase subunit kin28 [Thelotrema lepadinum]
MAVSPNIFGKERMATKAKSLAVRTNSSDGLNGRSKTTRAAPEVAEMNQDTKKKYVKGLFPEHKDPTLTHYHEDRKLGEGTYAVVSLGHLDSDPSFKVAIKKIKVVAEHAKEGILPVTIREIRFLQELRHPNIIALHDVYASKTQNISLVLEYLPLGDLEMLIRDSTGVRYGLPDIKAWMGMLGRAVWFCHENFVLHRDIKPNNLLIAADGEVKLADFGLARSFADPHNRMTFNVITRWYRPPELLYNARHYGGAVDIWSMGLVFAELALRMPFLAGDSDIHQLDLICQAIGTPTEANWPGVSKLPNYVKPATIQAVRGKQDYTNHFGIVGSDGVDLIMSTLILDPRKRVTATQFLQHKWWTISPPPTTKEKLPKKAGGPQKMGEDLKRRGGELDEQDKVARKLDFGSQARG